MDTIKEKKPNVAGAASLKVPKPPKEKIPKNKIKKQKNNKATKTKFSPKRVLLSLLIILIFSIIFSIVGFSGAVFAHQYRTYDKSLYGVTFMGEELGGLKKSEVVARVTSKLREIKLIFEIEGEVLSFNTDDAGIFFDESLIATEIMANRRGHTWFQNFYGGSLSLAHKYNMEYGLNFLTDGKPSVQIKYQINEAKLTKFIEELSKKYHVKEKNAGLVMNGSTVQVIPAVYGKQLVTGAIRTQIETALDAGKLTRISINTEEVDPKILENDVQVSISEANQILENTVTLKYEELVFRPAKNIIGSWVKFSEVNGVLKPRVDGSKVRSYLAAAVAKEVNIAPINQKVKITNGKKREITRDGKDGLAVDVDSLAANITESLNAKRSYEGSVPTYIVKYKTEVNNVLVADWSKYIEISIARQEMCAYLKGGEKINCWKITTGAAQWPTPRGTFLIMRKQGAGGQPGQYGGGVCMPNPPSTVPLCGINYVSYFTSAGHAIHEAWWRSSTGYNAFGNPNYAYNGSHGCINATYNVAKWIYNWAPLGTPVVIH